MLCSLDTRNDRGRDLNETWSFEGTLVIGVPAEARPCLRRVVRTIRDYDRNAFASRGDTK